MKISLITVSFNSALTIEKTLKSVLNQDNKNFEYIIVDGMSTDDTLAIIKSYQSRFYERNISLKIISEKDNGIYDAMNKGLKIATNDVVGFLNSDDIFYDNKVLSEILSTFNNDNIDCLFGNLLFVDAQDKIVRNWISRSYKKGLFRKSWTPAHPTFYCKKEIYDELGGYRTDYKIAADVDLMYKFLELNSINSKYINKYFIRMMTGGVSTRGFKSTYIITTELMNTFRENGERLNVLSYLFYKIVKMIKQKIL